MGVDDEFVRILVARGGLIRVRQAWYALPATHLDVQRACRAGGRLACVSALRFLGEEVEGDGLLHIEIAANALARRPDPESGQVRVHQPRRPSRGDRAVVAIDVARNQWEQCGRTGR